MRSPLILLFYLAALHSTTVATEESSLMTLEGPITTDSFQLILTHEHVMSWFGQDPYYIGQFDAEDVKKQVVPYLKKIRELGCTALVECTTAYFGRNVKLLQELSEESGLPIITNTGWYAAANDRYVPNKAYQLSAEEIAQYWIREWKYGIDGTEIRPGFIKLAVDRGPLSDIDRKLLIAGTIAHLETGLVIAVHTGDNPDVAAQQLTLFKERGVSPSAWIWTHAQNVKNADPLIEAAEQGAWISLDGVRTDSERREHILGLLLALVDAGHIDHILLSHDGNSYPSGRDIRPFDALMTDFIPLLKDEGFTDSQIRQMTVLNPREAFAIKIRAY